MGHFLILLQRRGPVCLSVTLACLGLGTVGATEARAQDEGPGVVPPSAAYIGEAAGSDQPELPRWQVDPRTGRTLLVHLSAPPAGRPGYWSEIERALDAWNAVPGLPVTFRLTEHAASADVRLRWVRRFDANQAGTTDWRTDGEGWLESAVVTLAVDHSDGTPMSDEFLLLVALHELGHVIGLPHSENPSDVMHPGNRTLRLSDRDVRSAQQLYREEVSDPADTP